MVHNYVFGFFCLETDIRQLLAEINLKNRDKWNSYVDSINDVPEEAKGPFYIDEQGRNHFAEKSSVLSNYRLDDQSKDDSKSGLLEPEPTSSEEQIEVLSQSISTLSFQMKVIDFFTISGRGTVITGKIELGPISIGDEVYFDCAGEKHSLFIIGIAKMKKLCTAADIGEDVEILCRGSDIAKLKTNMILYKLKA